MASDDGESKPTSVGAFQKLKTPQSMNDTTQTIIRSVLKVGGGALAAKGLVDDSGAEQLVSAIIVIISVAWGIFHRKAPAAAK